MIPFQFNHAKLPESSYAFFEMDLAVLLGIK